ncbi:HlyD family secretion protein [Veronia pacifica]|uniref:Membrane fusion protein biotin-lipoyl like domain-containing protein n=1 Tax=Veronia pacifica TaxID=1080227 RepID=A0A1C3E950_9GAMM|nr:HlyD family efflux transporter periplasmic adaptor subunit [Veronia pacifica]ODA29762.1 hypothetical protein A8L45_21795 [Veronia pacifica]
MSQHSLKAASAKRQQWTEFGVRFWLALFRLMPNALLSCLYTFFWLLRRSGKRHTEVFCQNVAAIMPDLQADLPEKSIAFSRDQYQVEKSRRLLPFCRFNTVRKMLAATDITNESTWLADKFHTQFIFIHSFGCLQSTLLTLVNKLPDNKTAVIVLDVYSRHYVSPTILSGLLRTLRPTGNDIVLRNDDPSLMSKLGEWTKSDTNSVVFIPTTLCIANEKCDYVNLFSRQVVASRSIESLINQTQDTPGVFTVTSNMSLFENQRRELTVTEIAIPKVASEEFCTAYSWNNEVFADLQEAVVANITRWHLWRDIESLYGRKQHGAAEKEMKSNFESFITGRVETPPTLRLFCYGILSIFVAATLVLFNVDYAASDTAVGYLLSNDEKAEVKIANTGQVIDLRVKEGDIVQKGDVIFSIKVSGAINRESPLGETVTAQLNQDIKTLERNMDYIRLEHQQNRKLVTTDIESKERQIENIEHIINKQQQHISLFRKQVMRQHDLYEKKMTSQTIYEGEQLKMINAEKELANYKFRKNSMLTDINRLRNQLKKSEFKLKLMLNNEEMKVSGIRKKLAELNQKRTVTVKAERSGIVNNLKVSLGDTVVVDGRAIMEITPLEREDQVRHAVLFIPTSFLNNTAIGQNVRVIVDAFPIEEFGSFHGKIVKMSSSSYQHSDFVVDLPRGSLYYKANIEIYTEHGKDTLPKAGFKNGMLISADILQPEISLFEWLFEPFFKAFSRMF